MSIAVIGVSHRTAPLAVRERLAWPMNEVPAVLGKLSGAGGGGAAILSTCNRIEFYLEQSGPEVMATAWQLAGERLAESAEPYGYVHAGQMAVTHLYRVTSGLDSMVLGEAQVQGQVRAALESARAHAGPILGRLFQSALRVGGRVRSETTIGQGAASVPSASVDLARKIFGSLKGRRALVLGSGEMAELAMSCLTGEGVEVVMVAHRHLEHARHIASRFGGEAVTFDAAWDWFADVDVVVSSTAAPHAIVTPAKVDAPIHRRRGRALCILDIAVPRDVDPAVGGLENVFLYDIDDLQGVIEATLTTRQKFVPEAERIIVEESNDFWAWYRGRRVVDAVRALREQAEIIRAAEMERALRKLGHLAPEDLDHVQYLTRALTQKFLHEPTLRLRQAAGNGAEREITEAARYLFNLQDDPGGGMADDDVETG